MKKNIVIIILMVTTGLSLMYAFVQKSEANKQREIAIHESEVARTQMIVAQQERERAEQQTLVLSKALEEVRKQRAVNTD